MKTGLKKDSKNAIDEKSIRNNAHTLYVQLFIYNDMQDLPKNICVFGQKTSASLYFGFVQQKTRGLFFFGKP